jgi:hypothetical protein
VDTWSCVIFNGIRRFHHSQPAATPAPPYQQATQPAVRNPEEHSRTGGTSGTLCRQDGPGHRERGTAVMRAVTAGMALASWPAKRQNVAARWAVGSAAPGYRGRQPPQGRRAVPRGSSRPLVATETPTAGNHQPSRACPGALLPGGIIRQPQSRSRQEQILEDL